MGPGAAAVPHAARVAADSDHWRSGQFDFATHLALSRRARLAALRCDLSSRSVTSSRMPQPRAKSRTTNSSINPSQGESMTPSSWTFDATRSGRAPELLPSLEPLEQIDQPHKRSSNLPLDASRVWKWRRGTGASAIASIRNCASSSGGAISARCRQPRSQRLLASADRPCASTARPHGAKPNRNRPLHLAADLGIEQSRSMNSRPARERKPRNAGARAPVQNVGRLQQALNACAERRGRTPAARATHPDRCRPRAATAAAGRAGRRAHPRRHRARCW